MRCNLWFKTLDLKLSHKQPQNTNNVETREEEETNDEYELQNLNFVLMTTQHPKKDFADEMITKANCCGGIMASKLHEKPWWYFIKPSRNIRKSWTF